MAFRSDVQIDWSVSPRIITVDLPSTAIVIQDIVDTCRQLSDDLDNLDDLHIVHNSFTGGKQDLGDGASVGITLTLNNAKLAFEKRGGPSFVQCKVTGGNLVAVDSAEDSIDPIQTTEFTQVVISQSSSPTIVGASATDIADAVWDEALAAHQTVGSLGEAILLIKNANIIETTKTIAGSTKEVIKTDLNKADGFYDDMAVAILEGTNTTVRFITSYKQTDGAITVDEALPFTPGTSVTVCILAQPRSLVSRIG